MEKQKEVLAWHFVGDTLRDGTPIPKDGEWLKYSGNLELCASGLHASIDPFDALEYAPGPTLCRVVVRGDIIHGSDKLVASERMIISRMDATHLLRHFARMQALSVVHLCDPCPPDVVLDFLMTGDESIRDAARDAAWAAAWDAARDAAWAAAWDAAWAAARAAARAAAMDAAWAAARDAARAAARKEFTDFVNECFGVSDD